jgi:protein gp37
MGDLFHESVPFEFIDKVFETILRTPQHRYQILTKRAERMAEYFSSRVIPPNAWIGVTVEAQYTKYRIDIVRNLKAKVKFLSCEPLLEDLGMLNLHDIDWVIVGGESGPQARPMKESWAVNVLKQAKEQGSQFFFKQWGTWGQDGIKRSKHKNGKLLQNRIIQEMPNIE